MVTYLTTRCCSKTGSLHFAPVKKLVKMSDFDVEMVEAGTDEMEDDTSDGKSNVAQVSGSRKTAELATKAYELPWLALKMSGVLARSA